MVNDALSVGHESMGHLAGFTVLHTWSERRSVASGVMV